MRSRVVSAARLPIALALIGLLAACQSDRAGFSPQGAGLPSHTMRGQFVCTVTMLGAIKTASAPAATVACAPAGRSSGRPGFNGQVSGRDRAADYMLGTQGTNVTLVFGTPTYASGISQFTLPVSVTNILTQALGTADGTNSNGIGTRVFFTTLPSATNGTGAVTVSNATGTATFGLITAPYFGYPAVIQPNATSPSVNWQFSVANTVLSFGFAVEVDAAVPAPNSVARWTVIRQGLTGNALNGLWEENEAAIYAVGNNNAILFNNGTTWSVVNPSTTSANYQAIYGTSGSDIWAVGGAGAALHYNGSTWAQNNAPTANTLNGVWASSSTNYIAVGSMLTLVQYNGTTWSAMTPPGGVPATRNMYGVWGQDASHVYAVGDNGTILFYNGAAWSAMTSPTTQQLLGIWGNSTSNIYAVGLNGTILHYNGATWSTMVSGTPLQLNSIGGGSATDIWAVGAAGATLHYNGTTWTVFPSVVGIGLASVTATPSGGTVYAVGPSGALMSYNGTNWALSPVSGLPIYGIWASSASDVWCSTIGSVLHYDGTNWTSQYVGAPELMTGVWGTSSTNVWVASQLGNVSNYSGSSWTVTNTTQPGFNGISGSSSSNIYAVGTSGAISQYNGSSWAKKTSGTMANLMAVWTASSSVAFAVASNDSIYQVTGSLGWTPMMGNPTGDTLYGVSGTSATDVWAVGQGGTILHLGTGNWGALATGAPATGLGAVYNTSVMNDVYALGANGLVIHYDGASWLTMPTPVTVTLRAAYATSPLNLYVGGDAGTVLLGTGP
jgi:hypothetical protein